MPPQLAPARKGRREMTKSITNNARGPRVVNAYVGKSERIEPVTLRPGETREDIQLLEDDPVTQGMIDSRELVLGDAKAAAKVRADAAEEGDDALFANDPTFLARREAAMAAGAQPGLADQLSEGKGGKPGAPILPTGPAAPTVTSGPGAPVAVTSAAPPPKPAAQPAKK
jgi:hypothetical protein